MLLAGESSICEELEEPKLQGKAWGPEKMWAHDTLGGGGLL